MVKVQRSLLKTLERLALSKRGGGQGQRRRRGRRPRRGQRTTMSAGRMDRRTLGHVEAAHAAILQRPFVASVPEGCVYDGEQGTINRCLLDNTIAIGAGSTAGIIVFHPNSGAGHSVGVTDGSTAYAALTGTVTTSTAATPGWQLLSNTASKVRSLAASIRFSLPSLSMTTVVGEFCVGVCSLDTIYSSTNVNSLFLISQARANITRDLHEVRWYPGSFDSKYCNAPGGGFTPTSVGSDLNDTNVVFVGFRGLPNLSTIAFNVCNIVEWTPRAISGLSVSSKTSAGSNHQHTVATLHESSPGWHHTAKQTAERLLEDVVGHGERLAQKGLRLASGKIFEGAMSAFGL